MDPRQWQRTLPPPLLPLSLDQEWTTYPNGDFFRLLFTDELVDTIVENTKVYVVLVVKRSLLTLARTLPWE